MTKSSGCLDRMTPGTCSHRQAELCHCSRPRWLWMSRQAVHNLGSCSSR